MIPQQQIYPTAVCPRFSLLSSVTIAQLLSAFEQLFRKTAFSISAEKENDLIYKKRVLFPQIYYITPPEDFCLAGKTKLMPTFLKYLGHFRPITYVQVILDKLDSLNKHCRVEMHKNCSSQLTAHRVSTWQLHRTDSPYRCCTEDFCLCTSLTAPWMGRMDTWKTTGQEVSHLCMGRSQRRSAWKLR